MQRAPRQRQIASPVAAEAAALDSRVYGALAMRPRRAIQRLARCRRRFFLRRAERRAFAFGRGRGAAWLRLRGVGQRS